GLDLVASGPAQPRPRPLRLVVCVAYGGRGPRGAGERGGGRGRRGDERAEEQGIALLFGPLDSSGHRLPPRSFVLLRPLVPWPPWPLRRHVVGPVDGW